MRKTILITGGSDGLGRATAERLKEKYEVVILSRNLDKLKKVADELGVSYICADVSEYSNLENEINLKFKDKKIDFLINNAGSWIEGPLVENNSDKIKEVFDVNTLGTIFTTKIVVPKMLENNSGHIINIISQAGLYGKKDRSVYYASKWAITGFTKSIELELKDKNISVTGFYPGGIKTNFFKNNNIVNKDDSKYLEVEKMVDALEFIIENSGKFVITELGVKNILN